MEVSCLGGELWKLRSSILGEEDDCDAVNHQEEDEVVAMNMIEAEAWFFLENNNKFQTI